MTKIITFIGKKQSGKDTRAKEYINQGYVKVAFADILTEKTYRILKFIPKNYEQFKTNLLFLNNAPQFISNILKKIFPQWQTGREFICNLSDELKIDDKLILTKQTMKHIESLILNGNNVVVTDLRMKHELVAIQHFCAENNIELEIIFCDYHSKNYEEHSTHNSEKLSMFLRDKLHFKDGYKLSLDNCFYYNIKGQRYKTAVPVYSNQFLDDKDKLNKDKLNDFERIVTSYHGE